MSAPDKPSSAASPRSSSPTPRRARWSSRVRRAASYNYYKPAKLRATMYEDVTVDVQPDPDRHLTQGWIYGFGDGPGGYPQEWTVAKSSNWHAFLDPNEEWEQTIYRNNAAVVRQVELCLQNAKRARAYDGWNTSWLKFLERNLGAWMHAENGMALHVFTSIQRSGPTNMINNAVAVNAAHKMRFAQDLALFNLDLSEADSRASTAQAHREVWQVGAGVAADPRGRRAADRGRRLVRAAVRHQHRLRAACRPAVPQRARDADRRAQRRLHHPDHRRHRRERLRPRPRLHAEPVPDADPRRAVRRVQQGAVRRAGWPPGCRGASTPPMPCSRSGRSRPRRPSRSPRASTHAKAQVHRRCSSRSSSTSPKELDK